MLGDLFRLLVALLIACAPVAVLSQDADSPADQPEYSRNGADSCLACHDNEAVLAIFRTGHAVPSDPHGPFGSGQLQCEACHGPGGAHAGRVRRGRERPPVIRFGSDSETDIATQNGMCLNCHGANIGFAWHSGPHGNDDVACADCHSSHSANDPVLATATQQDVCADCHQLQAADTHKAFSHPFIEDRFECTSCHAVHGEQVASSLARDTVNDTCFQCHAEKRGPMLWEHAPVSEDCSLCHAPHGSNHPGMLTRRAPLLCQSCHSQSGHPSLAYQTDGLPSGAPTSALLGQGCVNCHSQIHGSNHPSGSTLMR